MWGDQPSIQRNKTTKRVVGVEVWSDREYEGDGKEGGLGETWKKGEGRQYRGVLHKIEGG